MFINVFISCTKPNETSLHMSLAPIDEETSEAGDLGSNGGGGDDDEPPITMIPRIMHTAPSPTAENPMTQIGRTTHPSTSSVEKPAKNGGSSNVDQIESVL